MLLAFGLVCAMLEAERSGRGQVVDAAMVDGSAALMAMFFSMAGRGFIDERGANMLDGGAHFYNTYETSDGKYICVGAIEPQFYALLVQHSGVNESEFGNQMDRGSWSDKRETLTALFKTKSRDEWCKIMEGTDICFAPVLSIWEAPDHPHNKARETFVDVDGLTQPAPAPRYSRTTPSIRGAARAPGQDTVSVLEGAGMSQSEINELQASGAVA